MLGEPDVKARLATFGFTPAPATGDDVTAWVTRDSQRYAELIKRTGATIN